MTKQHNPGMENRGRTFVLFGMFAILLAGIVGSNYVPAGHTQETRTRRSGQSATSNPPTAPTPRATAVTPINQSTSSLTATPTPRPIGTPAATQTPSSQATPTPTPAPSPVVPSGTGIDRIAPQLGPPPPIPKFKPTPTPTPPEEFGEGEVVRVDTELVTLNVRVIDRNNRPIDNVRENDLHVFESGIEQPIVFFSREEVPISYGMAVDNSGSLRSQLQSVIDAGKTIINSNKPGDETFIIRFVDTEKIELKQDFTANKDSLIDTLDEFFIEGGSTAIIDAVYLAAEHAGEYKKGDDNDRRRRALIVITDGEDRDSKYSQEQLFARLRESDVQIYVIGFVNELDNDGGLIRKSTRDRAVNLLNKLASETGGRAFYPQSLADLPQISNEIIRDMRTQYILAYSPTNKARDGTYRAIKVSVSDAPGRDKRIALTRSGRTAPRGPAPTSRSTPLPPRPRLPATNRP